MNVNEHDHASDFVMLVLVLYLERQVPYTDQYSTTVPLLQYSVREV